jgi:hypothetical protein
MAESKRTFQSAKMDRDADERILRPGEYRDALNISVDFSEDGNVGAIENLKGNQLIDGQDILGLSTTSNPNAKVIGTYANPESDKIYYFVTGDNSDAIFEYDGTAGTVSTVIIDSSIAPPTPTELTFKFQDATAQASVAKNGAITVVSELGEIESVTQDFNTTVSTSTERKIDVRIEVPSSYSNKGSYVYGQLTANQPPITAPEVIQDEPSNIATTSFKLNGRYTNNSAALTDIGFYWIVNTGGSSTINVYSNKFVVTEDKVINNNALLGEIFPRVIDPFDGVSGSDIIVIDKNNSTVSASTYTFTVSQGNNPAEITFSTLPSFPVTVAQTSTATTLSNAYTAAQIQASGTQVSLSSAITSPFSATVTGQTQGTQIAAVAYATNSVGTTLSDVKYFTLTTSSINRVSGTEYFLFPNIVNGVVALGVDDVDARNVGYGTFYKSAGTSLNYKTFFMATGPSNDGLYANRTTGIPTFSVTPSGPSFSGAGFFSGMQAVRMSGTTIDTSYQVTISGISGFTNKTFRVNVGSPSGTFYTSTLNLNLTGIFVASANINSYEYNVSTGNGGNGLASFVLGPVQSGEKMACCIPLNNTATTFTVDAPQAFVSAFDATKLTVTVSGKTEGVDFNYYIEDTSTAMFGNVPGIIFEGTPSLLGATPTVNITYTP